MNQYYEKEEELLERWKIRLRENEPMSDFVPDGMLYRGKIDYVSNHHGNAGYWTRARGHEASQWDSAAKRLLILTKDLHDVSAWDIREETGRSNNFGKESVKTEIKYFYPNLTLWSYSILNAMSGNDITE